MLTEARDVNRSDLASQASREYGLHLSTPTFLPVGEDSYAYLAKGSGGAAYFIRLVEDPGKETRLEAVYRVVETLGEKEELTALVVARRTRRDTFLFKHQGYLGALFPFIDGRILSDIQTPGDRTEVGRIVAALHGSGLPRAALPRAGLEHPFEAPIRRALARAESPETRENHFQRRVGDLLTAHRENVEETLRMTEELRVAEVELVGEWVLTHGEPHLGNFVKDPQGALHLTDCGGLAYGPPERDLFAFVGRDFDQYIGSYVGRRRRISLEPRLFEFYFLRWALQEIADYSTRILFRRMGPEEDAHAWTELRDYLPTRHDEIARAMEDVREVVGRLSPASSRGRHA